MGSGRTGLAARVILVAIILLLLLFWGCRRSGGGGIAARGRDLRRTSVMALRVLSLDNCGSGWGRLCGLWGRGVSNS